MDVCDQEVERRQALGLWRSKGTDGGTKFRRRRSHRVDRKARHTGPEGGLVDVKVIDLTVLQP